MVELTDAQFQQMMTTYEKRKREKNEDEITKSKFDQGVLASAKAFKILHGDTELLSAGFKKMLTLVTGGAVAGVIMSVVHSLGEMGKTFNKMTDIGQNFGGSIFKMQELAGQSGLSLEQFTTGITKASVVVAQMSGDQVKAVEGFNKYQTSVRNTLKVHGFYGMSLTQLSEMTAEHADTLRQTYQWEQMTVDQRASSSSNFIKNVSAMAAASGKNRDALAKQTAEIMKAPRTAAAMSDFSVAQQQSTQAVVTMITGISEQAGTALGQLLGEDGRAFNVPLIQDAINSGLSQLMVPMQRMGQMAQSGMKDFDPRQFAQLNIGIRDTILANKRTLLAFPPGSVQRAAGENMLKWAQSMAGLKPEEFAKRLEEAQTLWLDGTTQAVTSFESTLNQATGAFREGFYGGIISMLAPMKKDGKRDVEAFQENLKDLTDAIKAGGDILGNIIGVLMAGMRKLRDSIETMLEWFGFEKDKEVFDKEGNKTTEHPAKKKANYVMAALVGLGSALAIAARLYFKHVRAMHVTANAVFLNGKPGALGGLGGGTDVDLSNSRKADKAKGTIADKRQGDLFDKAKPKGRMGRFWQGTKGVFKSAGRSVANVGGSVAGTVRHPGAALKGAGSSIGGMFKGVGGMASSLGGLLKNPAGMIGTLFKGVFKGVSFMSLAKGAVKGFWGFIASMFIGPILDLFGSFRGKESIKSMVGYAGLGATIGSVFPVIGTFVGALVGGFIGLIIENFNDITGNIGSFFSNMGNWAANLVNSIVKWVGEQLDKVGIPGWDTIKAMWCGTTPAKPAEVKPPDTTTKDDKKTTPPPAPNPVDEILKGIRAPSPPMFPVPPPEPDVHAAIPTVLDKTGKLTPAITAEAVRLVKADTRLAIKPPAIDDDPTEALNRNLLQLSQTFTQRALDEQRRNETDTKTMLDFNNSIKEQTEVLASLLNKGNTQRDDANRKGSNLLTH